MSKTHPLPAKFSLLPQLEIIVSNDRHIKFVLIFIFGPVLLPALGRRLDVRVQIGARTLFARSAAVILKIRYAMNVIARLLRPFCLMEMMMS